MRRMERKVQRVEEEARKQTQQAKAQAARKAEDELAKLRLQIEESARLEAERAENQTRLQMGQIKVQAMREAEEEVARVRGKAQAESLVRTAARLKNVSSRAAGIAVTAAAEVKLLANAALIAASRVVCEFDPEEGFALNEAARAFCVARWKSDSLYGKGDGEGDGIGSPSKTPSHHAAIRVDYHTLIEATNSFNEQTNLIGKGASCRVFRGDVYGHPTAIKVFNETAGAWDDKQIEAEINHLR